MDNERFGRDQLGRGKYRLHGAVEAASPVEWKPLQRASEIGTSGGDSGRSRFKSLPRKMGTPALPQFPPWERKTSPGRSRNNTFEKISWQLWQ